MNSSVEKLLFRFGRFYYYNVFQCTCIRYQCLSLAPTMQRNLSFCGAHILSHFLCISLMYLSTEFPAFTMFAISCHALVLTQEVIDEENFAFKITFLFSYSSNNTTFSLSVQFGFR